MAFDPLSEFLQKGAVPVQYEVRPQPVQPSVGFMDFLNPINWLKTQMKNNPQYKQVLDLIEQNGGDAKTAFYNECQKRGVNPDSILQQVRDNPMFKQMNK